MVGTCTYYAVLRSTIFLPKKQFRPHYVRSKGIVTSQKAYRFHRSHHCVSQQKLRNRVEAPFLEVGGLEIPDYDDKTDDYHFEVGKVDPSNNFAFANEK